MAKNEGIRVCRGPQRSPRFDFLGGAPDLWISIYQSIDRSMFQVGYTQIDNTTN